MADLASCYFCGVALDEPLSEQAVVPADLRGPDDDAPTVALCPTCEEKLGRVTDAIAAAVGSGSASDDSPGSGDDGSDSLAAAADDLVEPGTGTPGPSPSEIRDVETRAGTDRSGTPPGSGGRASDPAESRDEGAEPPAEPSPGAAGEPGADRADADGDGGGPTGEGDGTGAEREGTDGTGTEEGGDSTDRSVVEGDHSVSALEYNKVMRLLQNREFPVDREEIVTVAASAYQVSRADCDRVIDVAIDRGLIEESGDELVRPE